jgi:hypothetical protein
MIEKFYYCKIFSLNFCYFLIFDNYYFVNYKISKKKFIKIFFYDY